MGHINCVCFLTLLLVGFCLVYLRMMLLCKGLVINIDCVIRNVTYTSSRFVMLDKDLVTNIDDCVIRNVKWTLSRLIKKLLYGIYIYIYRGGVSSESTNLW